MIIHTIEASMQAYEWHPSKRQTTMPDFFPTHVEAPRTSAIRDDHENTKCRRRDSPAGGMHLPNKTVPWVSNESLGNVGPNDCTAMVRSAHVSARNWKNTLPNEDGEISEREDQKQSYTVLGSRPDHELRNLNDHSAQSWNNRKSPDIAWKIYFL